MNRDGDRTKGGVSEVSPWAPLAGRAFAALWIAQLISNVGTWMQAVGAQWLLIHQPNAATLTSLVQAASLVPVLFVSLPAGVLADVMDRRHLLIGVSVVMGAMAGALAGLTGAGLATPTVLLSFTFLMGCGQAFTGPAWQAVQPELVRREQIPAAAALGSLNVNIARAVGPALAGLLVAVTSPAFVFTLNALSFGVVAGAVIAWRRRPAGDGHGEYDRERLTPALGAGTRYVRNAPGVRRILLRSALFVLPASALWALLPVVASQRFGLGSGGYGLLLGALGLGAILGAVLIPALRAMFSDNVLLVLGTLAFALGSLACAVLANGVVAGIVLVVAGLGWLVNLSTLNTALQLKLAGWVRARGMAVYLVVFLGGQGVAALVWGPLAQGVGPEAALLAATVLLVLSALTVRAWPMLVRPETADHASVSTWPEPVLVLEPAPQDGPIAVEVEYTIAEENTGGFTELMAQLERSRRRTGATWWGLFRDAAAPQRYVELFIVPSWSEHLRQHGARATDYDAQLTAAAKELASEPPTVRHLVPPSDGASSPDPGEVAADAPLPGSSDLPYDPATGVRQETA